MISTYFISAFYKQTYHNKHHNLILFSIYQQNWCAPPPPTNKNFSLIWESILQVKFFLMFSCQYLSIMNSWCNMINIVRYTSSCTLDIKTNYCDQHNLRANRLYFTTNNKT